MTAPSGSRELAILRLAARCRLGSVSNQLLRESLRDPFDGGRLVEMARRHEVHPLLGRSLDRVEYPRDRAWRRDLRDACRRELGRNLMLESELDRLGRLLERCRIPSMASRGPRFAREIYGSPELRISERPEIFVRREDASRAWSILEGAGYRLDRSPREEPAAPGGSARRALALIHDAGPLPVALDLAWAPPDGPHARVDLAGLWRRAALCPPGGPVPAFPSPADLLLLASLEGCARGWGTLRLVSDVDACITRYRDELDWGLLASRARQWRMGDILERALKLTSTLLMTDLPDEAGACLAGGYWAHDPRADPRTWSAEADRLPAGKGARPGHLALLRGRRGLRHVTLQLLSSLPAIHGGAPGLPVAAGASWGARAATLLRRARAARFLGGGQAELPGSLPGGRF